MCLVYGLCAIPAGFLADRFGSRRMLVLAAGGCTLSLLLVAAAPSFPLLALGLVLLGLSAGLYHPSGLSLLSRAVASGERGRAIGIHGAGGNLGEAIAPAWAWWFATQLGWRAGFAAAAALALLCGLLALTLPASRSPHAADPAVADRGHRTLAGTFAALGRTLLEFARNGRLLWLLLSLVAAGFIYRGFLTFLSLHLADRGGAGTNASYIMSAVLLAGMVAQRFGGGLADRRGRSRERLYLTVSALAPPLLLLLAMGPRATVIASALAFGFAWALAQPVANALTAAYARETDHGLLYGIQFAATFGVGSFASTVGVLLADQGGTPLTFLGLAGVALVQVVAVFALLRAGARAAARDRKDPNPAVSGL
jgi:MFS family permease